MKIKEYNQMMSYLTRPNTKTVVKNKRDISKIQNLKKTIAVTPIPQFNINYKPYKRDPKDVLAEANYNKILDDVRKQKELEATQGLPGLIPNSSKIIERSESRMKQLKTKTNGGDDDL